MGTAASDAGRGFDIGDDRLVEVAAPFVDDFQRGTASHRFKHLADRRHAWCWWRR